MCATTITKYQTRIDLRSALVGDVETIIETARGVGYPAYDEQTHILTVVFEVGGPDGIADMWDLREHVEELEAQIGGYLATSPRIGKPEVVA